MYFLFWSNIDGTDGPRFSIVMRRELGSKSGFHSIRAEIRHALWFVIYEAWFQKKSQLEIKATCLKDGVNFVDARVAARRGRAVQVDWKEILDKKFWSENFNLKILEKT